MVRLQAMPTMSRSAGSPMVKALFWTNLVAPVFAATGTIADIEHVVLFMQENRAFDHYFGTMAGVRGFKDPNVQINSGTPVWYQGIDSALSNETDTLLPWYLNYLGGSWDAATQCMVAGSNSWSANHDALNGDLNNQWAIGNTPYSWGHFTRKELPNHFAIAEGWTVGDMYQESVIASTSPNRVSWASGTIQDEDSVYIDNNEVPGCDLNGKTNCYPLTWKTAAEVYQANGVSWQVYQDVDNFDDNPLAWFKQFQDAANGSNLNKRGLASNGLEKFYEDCASGNLPEVSYIIGPAELSEHPPYQPQDGAWLWQKIVDVVTSSPAYKNTVLIISYDETGGWGDHVTPYHSPAGTPIEWIIDPYSDNGTFVYTGPGYRVPFVIVSPWTTGGNVYTEHADHSSQIKFVEQWQSAKGKNVTLDSMAPWRRANMADLTKAFDFAHPSSSIPKALNASYPLIDSKGNWDGYSVCEATYSIRRPPVPYGNQTVTTSLQTETGFKRVRGQLTEGRYLTFEMNGYALTASKGTFTASKASSSHNAKSQRFVIHQQTNGTFAISSATDGSYVHGPASWSCPPSTFKRPSAADQSYGHGHASSSCEPSTFTIIDLSNGNGHALRDSAGDYLAIRRNGQVSYQKHPTGFAIFSVSYDD